MGLGDQLFRGSLWQRAVAALFNQLDSGNTLSTSETETNETWIDGKKIYRKVIAVANFPNATSANVAHGVTGIDNTIRVWGRMKSGTVEVPLPNADPTAGASDGLFRNGANIEVRCGTNRSSYSGHVVIEYTKT